MNLFDAVFRCLGCAPESDDAPLLYQKKQHLDTFVLDDQTQTIVNKVLDILLNAEKPGWTLRGQLNDAVGTEGWTEDIAKGILAGLQHVIQQGSAAIGPSLQEAVDVSTSVALNVFEFAKDHPIVTGVFVTIVALGVLYLFTPWVLEALGFGIEGPLEGEKLNYTSVSLFILFFFLPIVLRFGSDC
jgi:hypothetical protein